MAEHITHDPIYNTVDRDDVPALIEVDRYGERTGRVRRDHLRDQRPLLGSDRSDLHRLRAAVRPRASRR